MEMSKNPKIDKNSSYWRRESSYLLDELKDFDEIYSKDVPYNDIISPKEPGPYPLSRKYSFGKTTGWGEGQIDPPSPSSLTQPFKG